MNRLRLSNNRLKFKTAGKLPIILEEFIEYKRRMSSTCNRLELQALGSQPVMPKNLPDHCLQDGMASSEEDHPELGCMQNYGRTLHHSEAQRANCTEGVSNSRTGNL